jgi:ArsR family transcriptional regulator
MYSEKTGSHKLKTKIFYAFADPARLEIIEYLRVKEKCVCEIIPHVKLIQPLVSRHLKILKECGIVKVRKEQNKRLYSISEPKIFEVLDALTPELVEALSQHMIEQLA